MEQKPKIILRKKPAKPLTRTELSESMEVIENAENVFVNSLQDTFKLRDDAFEPDPEETRLF